LVKKLVNNISSVGIIYRETDPSQIFLEIKDDGLPLKAFRRHLCPIGGNWIGEAARQDMDTWQTFCRELMEELTLENADVSTLELSLLGFKPRGEFYRTSNNGLIPSDAQKLKFDFFKKFAVSLGESFGDYVINIPKTVLDQADPGNTREGFSTLTSYWLVPVLEDWWEILIDLQNKFGNLSNESITVITSLEEIVKNGTKFAFGHDLAFQDFFLGRGFTLARQLPLVKSITHKRVGRAWDSYEEYLEAYDVARMP
jgi:hypothetical protein